MIYAKPINKWTYTLSDAPRDGNMFSLHYGERNAHIQGETWLGNYSHPMEHLGLETKKSYCKPSLQGAEASKSCLRPFLSHEKKVGRILSN